MKNEAHVVDVAVHLGSGEFVASCQTCGPVGQPQEERADAEAIAERHAEVGGFERAAAS